jgi:hypothetical protein
MLGYSLISYITGLVGVIAVWRLIELIRAPVPTRGRILVFALFASSFVSNAAAIPVIQQQLNSVANGLSGLISFVALFGFFVGFVIFFGGARPDSWYGRVGVQLGAAAAGALALVLAWAISIPSKNSLQYLDLPPNSSLGPVLFSLISNLYLLYACLACAYLAATEAARSSRTGRVGFTLSALGMVLCLVGGPLVRVPATLLVWTGIGMAPGKSGLAFLHASQGAPFVAILGSGIVLVALGLISIALRTVAGKSKLWVDAKRNSLTLLPLWRDLAAAMPKIALHSGSRPIVELIRIREVRYRYERRVVECFDGLWRLSPYVEDPDDDGSEETIPIAVQAELVWQALARLTNGADPLSSPVAIAAASDGNAGHALLALARAYAEIESNPAHLQSAGVMPA